MTLELCTGTSSLSTRWQEFLCHVLQAVQNIRMGVSVRLGRHKHETWTLTQHLTPNDSLTTSTLNFSRLFLLWTFACAFDLKYFPRLAHCRCRLCAQRHLSGITDKETLLTSHPFLSSPPVLSCLWAQCWSFSTLLKHLSRVILTALPWHSKQNPRGKEWLCSHSTGWPPALPVGHLQDCVTVLPVCL